MKKTLSLLYMLFACSMWIPSRPSDIIQKDTLTASQTASAYTDSIRNFWDKREPSIIEYFTDDDISSATDIVDAQISFYAAQVEELYDLLLTRYEELRTGMYEDNDENELLTLVGEYVRSAAAKRIMTAYNAKPMPLYARIQHVRSLSDFIADIFIDANADKASAFSASKKALYVYIQSTPDVLTLLRTIEHELTHAEQHANTNALSEILTVVEQHYPELGSRMPAGIQSYMPITVGYQSLGSIMAWAMNNQDREYFVIGAGLEQEADSAPIIHDPKPFNILRDLKQKVVESSGQSPHFVVFSSPQAQGQAKSSTAVAYPNDLRIFLDAQKTVQSSITKDLHYKPLIYLLDKWARGNFSHKTHCYKKYGCLKAQALIGSEDHIATFSLPQSYKDQELIVLSTKQNLSLFYRLYDTMLAILPPFEEISLMQRKGKEEPLLIFTRASLPAVQRFLSTPSTQKMLTKK